MAFKLTGVDHRRMDRHFASVLDAYKHGDVTRPQAVAALAKVATAAAMDDEDQFSSCLVADPRRVFDEVE